MDKEYLQIISEGSKAMSEALKTINSVTTDQLRSNQKTIKYILVASLISNLILCSTLIYFIFQSYNYNDYPAQTITNTNNNMNGGVK